MPSKILTLLLGLQLLWCAVVDSAWQGAFVAFSDRFKYQLRYPVPDEQPILQFDRGSQHSLVQSEAFDIGQTLSLTIEETEYLIVVSDSALLLHKDDPENAMLVYMSKWPYPEGYRARRLLKSAVLDEAFFVLSDQNLVKRFEVDTFSEVHTLYVSQPGFSAQSSTVSTVAQSLSGDDVIVLVLQSNFLQFYSLLQQGISRSVDLAEYCDNVTTLYSLPPVIGNSNISFIVNCDKDGQELQYHVLASYLTNLPLEVHRLDNIGIPVATSTHLAIRHGNSMTVYDRRNMDMGVPRTHATSSPVQRVISFEADGSSFFLIFEPNTNVTQIAADAFFNRQAGSVRMLPNTLQGSCDPVCLPITIADDALLMAVVGGEGTYDTAALTLNTDNSTLTEVARVRGVPEPPAFVEFIADPFAPTPPNPEPPITTPEQAQTTTEDDMPPDTTGSMQVTEASILLLSEKAGIGAVCGLSLVVLLIVAMLAIACYLYKRNNHEEFVKPSSESNSSATKAPSFDKSYNRPISETGEIGKPVFLNTSDEVGIDMNDIQIAVSETQPPHPVPDNGDIKILIEDTEVTESCPVDDEQSDAGYNSAKLTPVSSRLSVEDRRADSRQSSNSLSLSTDVSSASASSTEGSN